MGSKRLILLVTVCLPTFDLASGFAGEGSSSSCRFTSPRTIFLPVLPLFPVVVGPQSPEAKAATLRDRWAFDVCYAFGMRGTSQIPSLRGAKDAWEQRRGCSFRNLFLRLVEFKI